jgi:hypothetical protein
VPDRDDHVLPRLRPRSWPQVQQACSYPLGPLSRPLPHAPWVSFVREPPGQLETLTWRTLADEGRALDLVRRDALENLSRRAGELETSAAGPGRRPRRLSLAHELAAEHVLLEAVMRQAQDRLAARALAVAVPGRGVLAVEDAFAPPDQIARLIAWTADVFAGVGEALAISPAPLLVKDGQVIGSIHGIGSNEELGDLVAAAPTPPVILEAGPEDRLLRPVAYFPDTQTVEMTCFLQPGRTLPEHELEALAGLFARGAGGRPVRSVRVVLFDRAMALRALRPLREAGAEAWFMDPETGEVRPLARDAQPDDGVEDRLFVR